LKFICIAMPPWPGDSEATYVKGIWQPTIWCYPIFVVANRGNSKT
jgi:hypothetical protein